jgi:hypothetical protein
MKLKVFFLIVFSILYTACSFGDSMILEKQDTQFFTVKVIGTENETVKLLISGLSFHSGLSVSEVTTDIDGDNLSVQVNLQPAVMGGSGRFEHEISIPSTVSKVLFGKKQVKIWDRSHKDQGVSQLDF